MKSAEPDTLYRKSGYGAPGFVVGKILNPIARSRLDPPQHIHDATSDALH
jgi:hypothetical protein